MVHRVSAPDSTSRVVVPASSLLLSKAPDLNALQGFKELLKEKSLDDRIASRHSLLFVFTYLDSRASSPRAPHHVFIAGSYR